LLPSGCSYKTFLQNTFFLVDLGSFTPIGSINPSSSAWAIGLDSYPKFDTFLIQYKLY
jgi:hypothetical protein